MSALSSDFDVSGYNLDELWTTLGLTETLNRPYDGFQIVEEISRRNGIDLDDKLKVASMSAAFKRGTIDIKKNFC